MPLKLMYITNDERVAKVAESSGVDWIFVDLEILGKEKRQGHLDTVISRHSMDDVKRLASVLTHSKLLVRLNPLHNGSRQEIDCAIADGADILMLPYFSSVLEVREFIRLVDARVQTCLLLETPTAVEELDSILAEGGIDYLHVGLNDLHLGYGKTFMFELLIDGTIERICDRIRAVGIPFGFGGIARLGHGAVPAEYILGEHYRLGSQMAILSRSFCDSTVTESLEGIREQFSRGVAEIRSYESFLQKQDQSFFQENQRELARRVCEVVRQTLAANRRAERGS